VLNEKQLISIEDFYIGLSVSQLAHKLNCKRWKYVQELWFSFHFASQINDLYLTIEIDELTESNLCELPIIGTITCLTAFHSYLFSGSDDGTICIWKTGSWQCEKTLRAHAEGVLGISVHPSGKLALSIGQDRALKTWNLIKGRSGYTTNLHGIADAVQWSTEGNFYAVSIANRLDVYSLESAKIVYTIQFGKKIWHIVFLTVRNTSFIIKPLNFSYLLYPAHTFFPGLAFKMVFFGVNMCQIKVGVN